MGFHIMVRAVLVLVCILFLVAISYNLKEKVVISNKGIQCIQKKAFWGKSIETFYPRKNISDIDIWEDVVVIKTTRFAYSLSFHDSSSGNRIYLNTPKYNPNNYEEARNALSNIRKILNQQMPRPASLVFVRYPNRKWILATVFVVIIGFAGTDIPSTSKNAKHKK